MAECACCGQTLPPDLPVGLVLRGIRFALYDRVRRSGEHGIRADDLFDYLYSSDPNGGPDTGLQIVAVHVWHVNQRLKKFGQRVRGGRTGHGAFAQYRLVNLNA